LENAAFIQWLLENGQVVLPLPLLRKAQSMNISPEELGYLALAMARCQDGLTPEELARDKWIKWCLSQGWAQWQGRGEKKSISFTPLWRSLFNAWQEVSKDKEKYSVKQQGEFNYGLILKWLDQERGTLSITLREKQVIQEFNLKYGWNTEFILAFLQLVFERGHNKVIAYQPVAKKVYENGINTIEGLIGFINDLDWIQYKVAEIKKCVGQYGGVTRPQRELYLKWQNIWKFGHELILRAAEQTVRTNNPSFKYIDAILQNWYEKGVCNITDAERVMLEHDRRAKPQQKRTTPSTDKKRISRIDNRDWESI
jgi:DnaD/phage-associated family protein